MPGSYILRPVEANLTHNTDLLRKMSPYCSVTVDGAKINGQTCNKGGKNPYWNDTISIPATSQSQVLVELMDKDKITRDDNIGSLMLDLREIQASGTVSRWYPLTYKNKAAGEILLETVYQPSTSYGGQNQYHQQGQQSSYGQNQYYQQEQLHSAQPGMIQREEIMSTTSTRPGLAQQEVLSNDTSRHSNVWTEQRQVVEPHRFMKEVEVVETQSALKEIDIMEPVKVMKEVQYTQAVPMTKQIELMEPQVVMKEIEVMEPRLVTKTIQVVENVPVTRKVEVIEMRSAIQEVQTFEPQTFTKQVEVTEYVPTMRSVEVTQPVTFMKTVEFVEPVITTQTITKELKEAVVIDQQITTSIGPSSVVGVSQEYGYTKNYSEMSKRWIGFETLFGGLSEQERLFEQQRLGRLSEQEWLREQQRLMGFNDQDRLIEQRRFYTTSTSSNKGGYSNYNTAQTTGRSTQDANFIQGSQGFVQGNQGFTSGTGNFVGSKNNNQIY